jgi:glycosyltransferase involved in cell wall biosynthesis
MRVHHVITRLIVGGAQENTVATVRGLRAKPGLEVELISGPTTGPEGSLEKSFEFLVPSSDFLAQANNSKLKTQNSKLILVPDLVRPIHPLKDFRALNTLENIFRAHRPDLVHTHSGKAGILGRLAAHRAGVPIIVHHIHGPSFGAFQSPLANLAFRAAERHAAHYTTHFISVADAMTRQYLAAGIGSPEKFTRIFSGFEIEPYLAAKNCPALRAQLGFAPDNFVVGKIARLFELKGHDDLFGAAPEIIRQNPRVKFLLIGDGILRAQFEARVHALGLAQHFIFTGHVAPTEIPALVGVMDLLVHLSRREGLPRALPQALAAAKPVLATDCDGANEVCFPNETGFLLAPGDRAALVQRVLQLAADEKLRRRLGLRGQQFVREHFPVQKLVDAQHALYLRLAPTAAISNATPSAHTIAAPVGTSSLNDA